MTAPASSGWSDQERPLQNTADLRHDNRERPKMTSPARRYGTGLTSVTAQAEMGSATSRNAPGRRHIVRLCAPGRCLVVASGLSETAAHHLAESINTFFDDVLGRPAAATACRQCNWAISWSGNGRPPLYCSPACRQQAYRERKR
jgi:hypothetical protein